MVDYEERLRCLALNDRAFVASVLGMGQDTIEASSLDPKTHALVRLAALPAIGGAQSSYREGVEAALAAGAGFDEIVGVLIALAPTIGLSRVVSAAPELALALGYDVDAALKLATRVNEKEHAVSVIEEPAVVEHLSADQRAAVGRAARAAVPRRSHAAFEPAADRRDPVELLEEQARSRVPELVPLRYGRMLVSPFTFFRGAAYLMAADLAGAPRTNLITQLCGDAHLSNFGVYAAPDRALVFDVNDFDETLPGPFEWDVKRLVASFAVAGRSRGFSDEQREMVNLAVTRAYREAIVTYSQMPTLDLWYSRVDVEQAMASWRGTATAKERERADKNLAKTRAKDSMRAFGKLTEVVDGAVRIVSDPPVVVPIRELFAGESAERVQETVHSMVRSYRSTLPGDRRELLERFRFVDGARKVVGVGSVGTRAWIALMLGRDEQDPLFLQFKEAEASVLEPFVGASEFDNHGQRVVEGQRLTQGASDIMLGWLRIAGPDGTRRDYYVRQLWDAKGSALVDLMNARTMAVYAEVCGRTLARAHARAGDSIAIAGYLGRSDTFDRALAQFAEAYADQNERDYATMTAAVESGRISAQTGI